MALSKSVEESLNEAQSHLRNALSFAARTEKPIVNKQIADLLAAVDQIIKLDKFSDRMDIMINKIDKDGDDQSFFNGLF